MFRQVMCQTMLWVVASVYAKPWQANRLLAVVWYSLKGHESGIKSAFPQMSNSSFNEQKSEEYNFTVRHQRYNHINKGLSQAFI